MGHEFEAFLHSSLSCAGADIVTSKLQGFLADSMAHIGMGAVPSVPVLLREWSVTWLQMPFLLLLFKEAMFDIPNGGWAWLVMADSAWDAACYLLGFFCVWLGVWRPGGAR